MMELLKFLLLFLYLNNVACTNMHNEVVKIDTWQEVKLGKGWTLVYVTNMETSTFTSIILQGTAEEQICISTTPECKGTSYIGKSVGMERVYSDAEFPSPFWYLFSNSSQNIFLYAKGYSSAPIVGACPKADPKRLNPNLQMKDESIFFNEFSFSYSTVLIPSQKLLMSCNDSGYWPELTYEVYVLPWNQRFTNNDPSFNSSSIYPLSQALFRATSLNVLRDGSLLQSFKMTSLKEPRIRFWKRLGLDLIVSVVVRRLGDLSEGSGSHDGSDLNGFYVSQNIYGCSHEIGEEGCSVLTSICTSVVVGVLSLFGLAFAHLGRRYYRFGMWFSGFCIGSLLLFAILSQVANFQLGVVTAISLGAGGLGFAFITCFVFWKGKPSNGFCHIPLYLSASFLIVAAIFFTPLGNQEFWGSYLIFYGAFFGVWIVLSLLVCVLLTKEIAVDLSVSIVGTYIFVFGVLAIFFPGTVFPYLLLDSIYRISIPESQNALSILWLSYVDIAAFIVWPSLIIIFLIINHYFTPPLEPVSNRPTTNTERQPQQQPRQNANWTNVDTWPPLPPDAYVSERTPLVSNVQGHRNGAYDPSAPPPYTETIHVPDEEPPLYQPTNQPFVML